MPRSMLRSHPLVLRSALLIGLGIAALPGCKQTTGALSSSGLPSLTGTTQVTVTATGTTGDTVDFGSVAVGQDESANLTLSNTGTSPLQILSVGAPSDGEFSVSLTSGTVIGQGQPLSVQVDFKPFSIGSKTATVVIQTDSESVPTLTLTLQGVGVALKLSVDPQTVDFGTLVVHTSVAKTITLINMSDLDLLITPSQLQGSSTSLFTISQTSAFTLKANGTAQIQATFSPIVPTPMGVEDNASFSLALNTGSPVTVTLQGNAVQSGLQFSPSPMDFNYVQPNNQRTIALHITNVGNQQVTISSLSVTDPAGVYALANGTPQSTVLASGASEDVNVVFSPTASQHYTGTLQVTSNDNSGVDTIQLEGYGGGASIVCTPTVLDFGVAPANFITTLPVICTNNGTNLMKGGVLDPAGELVINATMFKFMGGSGVFSASIDPQANQGPLAAGQSTQIDVAYAPVGTENDTTTLTIASNVTTPPAPPVLTISGQGLVEKKCYYSLSPTSLNWGSVKPGGSVYTQAFTITNQGPNECLVNAVSMVAGSDSSFSLTPIASQRLSAPGAGAQFPTSLVVPVSFSPQSAGNFTGTVTFGISDPDGPVVHVPLAGTGGNSCFLVKPSEVNFGVVGLSNGQYCQTGKKNFVGVNGCATPVTITGLALSTGTTASPFALIAGSTPVVVQAGGSSPPFEVGFKPTASGSYYGSAQVQTDLQQASFGVFFEGTAATGDSQTDHFVGQTPKADILWVMDTDDDDDERTKVAAQAPGFVQALISDGLDFQIAVTSSDSCGQNPPPGHAEGGQILPCPNCKLSGSTPTIVTLDDFNAGTDLATLMAIGGRAQNSCTDDEHFFETSYEALVSGAGATYNALNSFVRPDAYLAIITVNHDDEDDNSRTQTPDYYASQFLSVKGADHPELFSWSYVNPSEYGAPGGHTPFNRLPSRIAAMLNLVGGVALDTTQTNWWKGILDLWQIVLSSNVRFPLSGTPVSTTIAVYLDGPPPSQVGPGEAPGVLLQQKNPNGSWNWEYDDTSNSIEVNPSALTLTAQDTLYVTYTLGCGG